MEDKLKIISVCTMNWIKGAIFIEAERDLDLDYAIKDLDSLDKTIEIVDKV